MMYAAYDRHLKWCFDFLSDNEDRKEVLREAQEEDPDIWKVVLIPDEREYTRKEEY